MTDLSIGTAGLVALLGYAVVFVGLIALMIVMSSSWARSSIAKKNKRRRARGGSGCTPLHRSRSPNPPLARRHRRRS